MKPSLGVFAVFALIAIALLTFGCTSTLSDKSALDQFTKLKENFSAVDSLPTNNVSLNDYISSLSALRGKTGGSAAKVVDAELFSAQVFYYLNAALSASSGLDPQSISCSSKTVKDVISSVALAKDYQSKAIAAINSLSADEKSYLRTGQLDAVNGFGEQISQLNAFFSKKC